MEIKWGKVVWGLYVGMEVKNEGDIERYYIYRVVGEYV